MKRLVLFFFLIVAIFIVSFIIFTDFSTSENDDEILVALAGQSNMVGFGRTSELTDEVLRSVNRISSQVHFFSQNNEDVLLTNPRFGPEVGIALSLTNRFKKVIMVKFAVGGTSINRWQGNLFDILKSLILERNKTMDVFFWMQGESDTIDIEKARSYNTSFASFLSKLKHDINTFVTVSGLVRGFAFTHLVNDALIQVSNATVNTSDLTFGDGIHYDTESTIELGLRMGESFIKFSAENE